MKRHLILLYTNKLLLRICVTRAVRCFWGEGGGKGEIYDER